MEPVAEEERKHHPSPDDRMNPPAENRIRNNSTGHDHAAGGAGAVREEEMSKKIVVVNAGPRKGWNTDTLLAEAAKGAESAGAEVVRFDLFRLEKYTGCISCFGCKKEKFKGHCICKDGLTPVLDAIRQSDGLIIGTPNYLGHPVPVLFIMTSNGPEGYYSDLMQRYQQTFQRFIGPTEAYHCGDTLQLKDYSKTDWEWSIFDPEAKQKRHDTVFPEECRTMFEKGAAMGR